MTLTYNSAMVPTGNSPHCDDGPNQIPEGESYVTLIFTLQSYE